MAADTRSIIAGGEPRLEFRRVTPRALAAAAAEFWLAGACLFAAWRQWGGGADADLLGIEMTLAYEFLGLMILRFFLLGQDARTALADRRSGPFAVLGKTLLWLFTGVALWFNLAIAVLVLPLLLCVDPWVGLTAGFLVVRRVWWGYAHRPRNVRQAAAGRAYWRLIRRIQWVAFGAALVVTVLFRPVIEARGDCGMAIQTAAGGLYFLILGVFCLVRDPRLEEFEDAHEAMAPASRPDVAY